MRRLIYGTLLGCGFALSIWLITKSIPGTLVSILEGVCLAHLWDVGVSSNMRKFKEGSA